MLRPGLACGLEQQPVAIPVDRLQADVARPRKALYEGHHDACPFYRSADRLGVAHVSLDYLDALQVGGAASLAGEHPDPLAASRQE
ncbi:MAG: hypothetical protein NVS9B1_02510 [Candidatus Dormibacteraceae bacterium]